MNTTTVPRPKLWQNYTKNTTNEYASECGTEVAFSIVPKVAAKSALIIFENSIKYYSGNINSSKSIPPTRSIRDIKNFSKKSRKNLFDTFNTINYSSYGLPLFLSLTWHYDSPDEKAILKTFIEKYLKRLKRCLPPFHYIWKFEFQKRGTPHFHIIIFPLDRDNIFNTKKIKTDITKHWLKLKQCKCEDCKQYAVKTILLDSITKSISYISKEIGKIVDTYQESDVGRYWSSSQNLRCSPIDIMAIDTEKLNVLITRTIKILEERIILAKKNNSKRIQGLEKSLDYIKTLIDTTNNITLFVAYKDIFDLINTFRTESIEVTRKAATT